MSRCNEYLPFWFFLGCAACLAQTFTNGPSAAVNADGRIEIFARGSDGAAWHNWQTSPGGSWSGWVSLGGLISGTPIAGVNADGRLEIFVRNSGNVVYHNYQVSPGGGWSGWIPLDGAAIATPPVVARNFDGRLQIFALGTDGGLWTNCQEIPGVENWSGWTSLGGFIAGSPAVAQNADGRLEVFVLGGGDGALYHNWQTTPGGAWSGFSVLAGDGNMATPPTVTVNNDGRLEVFDRTTDGAGWHIWQWNPSGSSWSSGETMGGGIVGSPTAALDGGTYLEAFVISPGGAPWVDYQSNGFAGWNSLGGIINAPPAIAMNFDGRLEIFGIGTDGNMYHDWQVSPAGSWYGWQPIGVPTNTGATNSADIGYFATDEENESNFANADTACVGKLHPGHYTIATTWPCGARVNIGFTGYKKTAWAKKTVKAWNDKLKAYYGQYVPVQLYISAGGPQSMLVHPVQDNKLQTFDSNGNLITHHRALTTNKGTDAQGRRLSVETQIIKSMTENTTLTDTLAHELGHTFGLDDCHPCGNVYNIALPSGQTVHSIVSWSVMDDSEPVSPDSNGWDYLAKNMTEGLPGPTTCDLNVVNSVATDYANCGMAENSPPPDQPTCTNGTTLGFADTGTSSTYTCGGQACDGCGSNCNNYQDVLGTAGQCGSGSSGSCPDSALCSDFRTNVFATDFCKYPSGGCPDGWYQSNYCCYSSENPPTPIIVDAFGEGFHMTGVSNGVHFRVFANESPYKMSWTDPRWRNGWLALDRNGNGTIDDFTELFGNDTVQPKSDDPNGYRALALFDAPMNGGNGNGAIDPDDSIYDNLHVWIDANHNGISEPEELHTLRELGIFQIDLRYTNSRYVDANGNQFRYRAKIKDEAGHGSNFCYDVLVQVAPEAKN